MELKRLNSTLTQVDVRLTTMSHRVQITIKEEDIDIGEKVCILYPEEVDDLVVMLLYYKQEAEKLNGTREV